jgi:hypothetical protein
MVKKAKIKSKTKARMQNKKLVKKNLPIKSILFIGGIILAVLITVLLFSIFIYAHLTFAANFADNILRPTIGNKATIYIEAFFFRIEDKTNQVKYYFVKQNPDALSVNPEKAKKKSSDNKFLLNKVIPLVGLPNLAGEGVWKIINTASSDAVMAETFFRPDQQRPYAIAYLVKMNMQKLILSEVAGTVEPGEYLNPGPGKIPNSVQKSNQLVAAFNGGFQKKDGEYGMIVGAKTYLPLQKNLATLVISKNTKLKIINYVGQVLGKDVVAVRQNGPILLQNGNDVSLSKAWNMQNWGLTTTNTMYTWRSGVGVTKDGDLIYAAGPSLVPETLAAALKAAGAVDAMQLDINPVWVRFILFNVLGEGKYNYYSLTKDMVNGGAQYLSGYQKDFFYLVEK